MGVKIRLLSIFFLILFAAVIVRLFYWQIIKGSVLSQDAQAQYSSSKVTSAPRGNILASDGTYWVVRTQGWLPWANPKMLTDSVQAVANRLAPFFVKDPTDKVELMDEVDKLQGILSKSNLSWVSLGGKMDDPTKRNIDALGIRGIGFDPEEDSYYPEASSAAHILGFVGKDSSGHDVGYFGLEGYYDLPLSGKPGFMGGEKNALGAPILSGGTMEVSAVPGVDLLTNVDKRIQILAETELANGIQKYQAKGGSVTIMDPYTGKIMAMASLPSFDPSNYSQYSNEVFKNTVISDSFEPGSIFKPIVMASAIDAGLVTPDTECDICSGPINVDGFQIRTWDNKYRSNSTMTEVIINSDNVGMSFVGQKLGADKLYNYLNSFGIGKTTGIDLQGEAAPPLRKKGSWSNVDLDTASFGQGVAVTGIEMVRAISVIANGGYLVTPRVVDSIRGDGWQQPVNTDPPVRIISEKAAQEAAQMMVQAANLGEAKWCKISGFDNVAGKTGTAQIPVAGHYDPVNTNHSFIGFAPADHPKFVMLVTLDSPQASPWASETAAPLWFSIARDLFPYLGVQPSS